MFFTILGWIFGIWLVIVIIFIIYLRIDVNLDQKKSLLKLLDDVESKFSLQKDFIKIDNKDEIVNKIKKGEFKDNYDLLLDSIILSFDNGRGGIIQKKNFITYDIIIGKKNKKSFFPYFVVR